MIGRTAAARYHLIAALFTVAVFGIEADRRLGLPIEQLDEAAVVGSTYYYYLAFVAKDVGSADWRHRDCLCHPPFAKYLQGLALALDGKLITSLSARERFDELTPIAPDDPAALLEELRRDYPPRLLLPGRLVSLAASALAVWLLYLFMAQAFSPAVGLVAMILLGLNGHFRIFATRATMDALLVLLVIVALFAQRAFVEAGPSRGRIAPAAAARLGLSLAALANTKITGVVAVPAAIAAALLVMPSTWSARRNAAASILLMLVFFAVFAIGLNPSLWGSPLDFTLEMFRQRLAYVEAQRLFDPESSTPGLLAAAGAFVDRALLRPDPVFQAIRFPVLSIGFVVGAARLASAGVSKATRTPALAVLLSNAACTIAATAFTFRLAWPRYANPALPLVFAVTALGLVELVSRLRALFVRSLPLRSLSVRPLSVRDVLLRAALTAALLLVAFVPKRREEPGSRAFLEHEVETASWLLREGRFEHPNLIPKVEAVRDRARLALEKLGVPSARDGSRF